MGLGAGVHPALQTPLRMGLAWHGHRAARPAPEKRCASLRGRGSRSGLGMAAVLVEGGGLVVGVRVRGGLLPRSWRPRASCGTGAPLWRSLWRHPPVGGPRPRPAMAGSGPAVAGRTWPKPAFAGPAPRTPRWPCQRLGSGQTASPLSTARIPSASRQASHPIGCTSASFGRAEWVGRPRRHWGRTRERAGAGLGGTRRRVGAGGEGGPCEGLALGGVGVAPGGVGPLGGL